MENFEAQKTPMGRVWLLVLASMVVTLSVSWFWHVSGMKSQAQSDQLESEALIANTERIAAYRDVLKKDGRISAAEYLETLSRERYGAN